ncbi:short-chain dehydrogenase [Coprinopsis marcescibilis]|uniref:Short-chain dehydrogenase n=1 Tax=Coprinopsis marcescibilis TaxID=230819 RepID=A0A5C3L613_COPMA|nr:short-chain dehydrogenase [Coprinopsis marcescibilis]
MASYRPQALFDLTGRVALVTGGGTGIGFMIAKGLAASGAKVYITGRRLEVLEKVASEWDTQLGGRLVPIQLDVTDKASIRKVKSHIEKEDGKLHILVNNAGQVGPVSRFLQDPSAPESKDAETLGTAVFEGEGIDEWANLFTINTFSIFFMTTAFLGLLAKGSEDVQDHWSSVVNISSISGITKLSQNHFCYNSAKAATGHLTKMLSTEILLKKIPIRVNAIAPGVYESEMTLDEIKPDYVDKIGKGLVPVPAKRVGTGEEVAGTVVYLVSKAGGYTHGQEIVVDGGYLAVNP